jgi:hypothetical protein
MPISSASESNRPSTSRRNIFDRAFPIPITIRVFSRCPDGNSLHALAQKSGVILRRQEHRQDISFQLKMTNLFGPDPSLMLVATRDKRSRYPSGHARRSRPAARVAQRTAGGFRGRHARRSWLEHGRDVIDRLIAERPEIFLLAMLKITQVRRIKLGHPKIATGRPARGRSGKNAPGQRRGRIFWPKSGS